MAIDKLCKMVNAKNAMELDWGEMLREYIEVAWSKEKADGLYADQRWHHGGSTIGVVLYDGQLSKGEFDKLLGLRESQWKEIGGDPSGETPITKLAFVSAMRRFCAKWSDCYKNFSKCEKK